MSYENYYTLAIEEGHHPINDGIIRFLQDKIYGRWLDVGCNSGWLLSLVPNGTGIDASSKMIELAKVKGLKVIHGTAEKLPFNDKEFDTVVMSCVLEQCSDWRKAYNEAKRVGYRVIGINPLPGSPWGIIGGNVKSIIPPDLLTDALIEEFDEDRYYFETI
jgi:ubiquinone/menaquinone biosynthesis C-methylase UbiE